MTWDKFENGYCLSIINHEFSHGLEVALGKWWIRKNTIWENFIDKLQRKQIERIVWDFIHKDLLQHPSWNNSVYAHLKPDDVQTLKERAKALLSIKNCNPGGNTN